ncbi:MAG: peptidoglycan DD-metalloendopeptidase family protein [Elusimicrobia bacterium]|nr:peptidoglycan DD-metalloendopeptidase family protein [Elusimicrobiota bacterium]
MVIFKHFKLVLFLTVLLSCFLGCKKAQETSPYVLKKIVLNEGDTLIKTLETTALPLRERNEIVKNLKKLFNPRYSKPGDYYEISVGTSSNPPWTSFFYYTQGQEVYSLAKSTEGIIETSKIIRPLKKVIFKAKGSIQKSLWESMTEQKIEPDLILDFADIFAWQIDFLTEPRAGDTFKIVYEKNILDDGTVLSKQILGARYNLSRKEYTAILFVHPNGKKGYYSPDGRSMISAFLKAPLQYRRISSYFTKSRYHPILKYYRPHLGVDYSAPEGTPVSSIGEGAVTLAEWKGDNGNLVSIKHPNGYSSFYGHLSRYGKGIRKGARVSQGQIVGYVGTTGLSTGPHLDFRVKKDFSFINYLKVRIPPATKIKGNEKESFTKIKKNIFRQFAELNYR